MTPEQVLSFCRGVATRSTLRGFGVGDASLVAAMASGAVVRVRRGVYALPQADAIAVARVAWNCEHTCLTAARMAGLPVSARDQRLHVAVSADRSSARPNAWPPATAVVHMARGFPRGVLTAAQIIDSAARCASRFEQLEMVDAALNRGLMSEADLAGMCYTSARTRGWLGRHCDGRSQSLLETRTRIALRGAGLGVEPQVVIPGVGRVDFLVNGRVVVETDGRGTHALEAAFDEDRRRDRACVLAGYPVMRFGYADVMGDIDRVVREVAAAVGYRANSLPRRPSTAGSRSPARLMSR